MTGRARTSMAITAVSIFFSMVMVFSISPLSAAPLIFAQTETSPTTATSSSNNTSVGGNTSNNTMGMMMTTVLNLGTPLLIDHARPTSITNITENTRRATLESNGTLMLPTGENVSTIGSGHSLVNTTGHQTIRIGEILLKTTESNESAILDYVEFEHANSPFAIGVAHIQSNSTGQQQLAPLNDVLAVFKSERPTPTEDIVTLWKWE